MPRIRRAYPAEFGDRWWSWSDRDERLRACPGVRADRAVDRQLVCQARPVYVLMDWGVGSAGDIFVSTFKGWRNVTLVGSASNGRSGNSIPLPLPNSGIRVRLSTMASFQKTGEMYDGFGIAPDVFMEARMSDWLGETDTVLGRVMAMARRGA